MRHCVQFWFTDPKYIECSDVVDLAAINEGVGVDCSDVVSITRTFVSALEIGSDSLEVHVWITDFENVAAGGSCIFLGQTAVSVAEDVMLRQCKLDSEIKKLHVIENLNEKSSK